MCCEKGQVKALMDFGSAVLDIMGGKYLFGLQENLFHVWFLFAEKWKSDTKFPDIFSNKEWDMMRCLMKY